MSKNIAIITENFLTTWKADDIDGFLSGCQECTILLAEALQRLNHNVTVYFYGPNNVASHARNGVVYEFFDEKKLEKDEPDTLILFKLNPLDKFITEHPGVKVIYWSSDVENMRKKFTNDNVTLVCLTRYHLTRNLALSGDTLGCTRNTRIIPHGIDMNSLLKNKVDKKPNTMLYSSSPDRGLYTLLNHWPNIIQHYPNMKLTVTYGFKTTKMIMGTSQIIPQEESLKNICSLLDIDYRGSVSKEEIEKLYWESEYWILPLKEADSELFCLNAIKAQVSGCKCVVEKIGALQNTVGDFIEYSKFIEGNNTVEKSETKPPIFSWDEVAKMYWQKLV